MVRNFICLLHLTTAFISFIIFFDEARSYHPDGWWLLFSFLLGTISAYLAVMSLPDKEK